MNTEGATRKSTKTADGTPPAPRHGNRPRPDLRKSGTGRPERPMPGGTPADRGDHAERPERAERGDRPARPEGPDRSERGDRGERQDRGRPRPERAGERGDRTDRANRPDRGDRSDRPERSERGPGAERSLYDGGSPSANRLGPAKAMRARDVSRPR